ncbi:hypothetical protein ACQBAR_02260 [Propionibacteriaceae bacterium Y1685]|uniref:WXG100-like domain-containing protein n=1 Tax=Microlunatus sp. Y1700 TaxID=3418487 RepID=UPI003B76B8B2
MGMQLPDGLRFALSVLGYEWPATDEDVLLAWADDWQSLAAGLGENGAMLSSTVTSVVERNEGPGLDAFVAFTDAEGGTRDSMNKAAHGCMQFASAFRMLAEVVRALKTLIIGQLIILAAAIALAVASGGWGSAGVLAAKEAAKRAIDFAIGEALTAILSE